MLLSAAAHVQAIAVRYSHCVDYVEFMLEQQLDRGGRQSAAAQGLWRVHAVPRAAPLCQRLCAQAVCVRDPPADHCPEGLLTIESDAGDGALEQPLQSIVSVSHAKAPLFFSLGAATRAALLGERYLHGAILHQFSHQTDASLRLTARARQFSSFVLLVGKIASADTFEPTHATIVQNKDDVLVPLLLEQIPSAKAFRDAIESLSPEQQRFAKAFRAMQLESTLFAVAVVEIKPQLERLLKLNADALTKEIRLTQDLMELFIEYQVPSDLLAYDGAENRDVAHKLTEVKRNVAAVQDMIKAAKQKELDEEKQRAEYERASRVVEPLGVQPRSESQRRQASGARCDDVSASLRSRRGAVQEAMSGAAKFRNAGRTPMPDVRRRRACFAVIQRRCAAPGVAPPPHGSAPPSRQARRARQGGRARQAPACPAKTISSTRRRRSTTRRFRRQDRRQVRQARRGRRRAPDQSAAGRRVAQEVPQVAAGQAERDVARQGRAAHREEQGV
jgi:hypothetical protein